MGVRNLYTLLHPYTTPSFFPSPSAPSTPLYIDGPALCHHIYHHLFALSPRTHAFSSAIPYSAFTAALLDYLTLLTTSGFTIARIYFDGGLPHAKTDTRAERLVDGLHRLSVYRASNPVIRGGQDWPEELAADFFTSGKWKNIGGQGSGGTRQQPLPAPAFIVLAAQRVLSEHPEWGQVTFTVPGEADTFLARDAVADDAIVLTGDSDLLVFPAPSGRGVLMLRDLGFPSPGCASAMVFRTKRIEETVGADVMSLAHQLTLDPSVSLGVLKERLKRVKARQQAGVGGDREEKEWREEYELPGPGGEGRCVEPRISEFLQQGEGEGERVMYLPVLWEDVQRASAWEVGRGIRARAYGARRPVMEIRRKGGRIAKIPIDGEIEEADADISTVLTDILTLSNPPLPQSDLAAVAEALLSLNSARSPGCKQQQPSPQWSWHRAHLFAMASAGWYSLLMHRELCNPDERSPPLPLLEAHHFLSCFNSQSSEATKLAKEIKQRVMDAARAAEEAEDESMEEAGPDTTGETEAALGSPSEPTGKGKRKSLDKVRKKKGKSKSKSTGAVKGVGGNMFAALA